jgi:hypothetical protein
MTIVEIVWVILIIIYAIGDMFGEWWRIMREERRMRQDSFE